MRYTNWESVPKHLMTKTALSEAGLSARGLKPVAVKAGGYGPFDLYDSTQAKPKRVPSEKQLAALAESRHKKYLKTHTCPFCKQVQKWPIEYIKHWGVMCHDCADEAIENHRKAAKSEAEAWAREAASDPAAIIFDTETTGLGGVVVEIAIISITGEVLLNTLVKNLEPIEEGAQVVHGISESELDNAPTWGEVWPRIEPIFKRASRVIAYNVAFDCGVIGNTNDAAGIKADLEQYNRQCAMDAYAEWYGEWSQKHGNFKWQALEGGHRALADCRACLGLIKRMAG